MPKRSGWDTKSARRFRNENPRPAHRMFRLDTNPKPTEHHPMNHIPGYFKTSPPPARMGNWVDRAAEVDGEIAEMGELGERGGHAPTCT